MGLRSRDHDGVVVIGIVAWAIAGGAAGGDWRSGRGLPEDHKGVPGGKPDGCRPAARALCPGAVWGMIACTHLDDDGGHEIEAGSGSCWAQSVIWHLASAGVATLESFDIYFVISRKSADEDKSVKIGENLLLLVMALISLNSVCVRKVSRMLVRSSVIHSITDS